MTPDREAVSVIPLRPVGSRAWMRNLTDAISDYGQASYQDGTRRRAVSDDTRAAHERIGEHLEDAARELALLDQLRRESA